MGYKRVVTYILESENGANLRAAGWNALGKLRPALDWEAPPGSGPLPSTNKDQIREGGGLRLAKKLYPGG